jgi:hypothetical protein
MVPIDNVGPDSQSIVSRLMSGTFAWAAHQPSELTPDQVRRTQRKDLSKRGSPVALLAIAAVLVTIAVLTGIGTINGAKAAVYGRAVARPAPLNGRGGSGAVEQAVVTGFSRLTPANPPSGPVSVTVGRAEAIRLLETIQALPPRQIPVCYGDYVVYRIVFQLPLDGDTRSRVMPAMVASTSVVTTDLVETRTVIYLRRFVHCYRARRAPPGGPRSDVI